ncbi:MAG: MBL fold metallo-hydrolase [Chloroflexota bacterium]|nr:MBL fold metallo-hydrolase [Chloroflexota bacterium]MDE2947380.1 MBL fold metallo-hydrolase [Chloroflexota bacterium]
MTEAGISQITDDIVQVRLPLPYKLNIVNCYLLRGADGWTLLDTGLNTAAARAQWGAAMKTLNFKPDDIEKIVLTHMHPDHFGLAGWWQRQAEIPIPVYLPEREMPQAQVFYRRANTPLYHQWMLDCGIDEATVDNVERALGSTRDLTRPHPVRQETLREGTTLRLGTRECRAIHAPGHSDGQLIFYHEAERLMLCGDHVLMKITPNIGSWPHSQPDPLGRFLASLSELTALDVRLALPGHRDLISDWRDRIEELIAHHRARLDQTLAAIEDGAGTVYQIAACIFPLDRLTPHEWRFAMAETLAHLNYLLERNQVTCRRNGVMRWDLV